jgi:hypothetical protein
VKETKEMSKKEMSKMVFYGMVTGLMIVLIVLGIIHPSR